MLDIVLGFWLRGQDLNLRPSGYEPDELPGCSTPRRFWFQDRGVVLSFREISLLSRFGGDLLSHVLRRSTIGVLALNGRVRDGIGCLASAMTTKPRKERYIGALLAHCFIKSLIVLLVVDLSDSVLLLLDQIKPVGQLVPVN